MIRATAGARPVLVRLEDDEYQAQLLQAKGHSPPEADWRRR